MPNSNGLQGWEQPLQLLQDIKYEIIYMIMEYNPIVSIQMLDQLFFKTQKSQKLWSINEKSVLFKKKKNQMYIKLPH